MADYCGHFLFDIFREVPRKGVFLHPFLTVYRLCQPAILSKPFHFETNCPEVTDIFMATVRKYTRARRLTQRMLNELIDHIEVHQAEKVDGVHIQKLTIHYNCVGSIEIPDMLTLPEPDVLIQTRKGVAVSYSA